MLEPNVRLHWFGRLNVAPGRDSALPTFETRRRRRPSPAAPAVLAPVSAEPKTVSPSDPRIGASLFCWSKYCVVIIGS